VPTPRPQHCRFLARPARPRRGKLEHRGTVLALDRQHNADRATHKRRSHREAPPLRPRPGDVRGLVQPRPGPGSVVIEPTLRSQQPDHLGIGSRSLTTLRHGPKHLRERIAWMLP
jgi:hypothetical protein